MNELAHVGVLGMKWGRRKSKSTPSQDHINASKLKKKKLKEMSNDEIQTLSRRIRLEQEYRSLNPSTLAKGKKAVNSTLSTFGQITAAVGTVTAMITLGKKIIDSAKNMVGSDIVNALNNN